MGKELDELKHKLGESKAWGTSPGGGSFVDCAKPHLHALIDTRRSRAACF